MMESALDEPEQIDDNDEEHLQHYDDAYARQYDNDHTWEQLQEDEHGNLRVVSPGSGAHPPPADTSLCMSAWRASAILVSEYRS